MYYPNIRLRCQKATKPLVSYKYQGHYINVYRITDSLAVIPRLVAWNSSLQYIKTQYIVSFSERGM